MTTTIVHSDDSTAIAHETVGQGPPLLLIDGAMCFREAGPMRELAHLLETDFAVHLYDRRGRGESGDTLPYDVERELEDIATLMQSSSEPWFVHGMSSGGVLALDTVVHGLPVAKVSAYEPPFFAPDTAYTDELIALLRDDRRGDAVALFMAKVGMPQQAIDAMRDSPAWAIFESIAPTLAYDDQVIGRWFPVVERASQVNVDVLILGGGASPDFFDQALREAVDALPMARHQTLEGQTHNAEASVLAAALQEFFLV